MIPLSPMMYVYAGVGVVILGLGIATKVQTSRLESCKTEAATFRANVKAVGDAQNAKTEAQTAADKAKQEKANVENAKTKRDLAGLYDAYGKLRNQYAGRSLLPTSAPGAVEPDRACFSRSVLDSGLADADGILQDGATAILRRGDQAIVDLNTARAWASKP